MKKTLIANDIQAIQEKDNSFLERTDVQVFTAATNDDVLRIHRAERVDLIMTRLDMPGMASAELFTLIREDPALRTVSAIMACANTPEAIRESTRCRVNAVMLDPLHPVLLMVKAQQLLDIAARESIRVHHASMGKLTGALPDGRKRGLSLANALSPAQGADFLGPTAVIKSITKLDHTLAGNGVVLDLKFHPDFFQSSKHRQAFRQLVESYFALGGLEIQFNVVSRETLINAQKNPEQYRNLVVRVSGFSAYFTSLDKTLQDEIIARTEYAYI